jgi:hypothetical protein
MVELRTSASRTSCHSQKPTTEMPLACNRRRSSPVGRPLREPQRSRGSCCTARLKVSRMRCAPGQECEYSPDRAYGE